MKAENKIKYTALVVFILTAIYSVGHHSQDEYFQILEFAQYKLGYINASDLPWEFNETIRSTIQPWLAFVAIKFLHLIHITNPFTIATILRIFSALFLWFVISRLNSVVIKKYFPDKKWSLLFYASTYLLWFVPFLSVRFSSENYSQGFLLLGIYFFLKDSFNTRNLLYTGIFLGFSVLFRYQLGIAVFAIFLWAIYRSAIPSSELILLFTSFFAVIIFGVYLDYLFYDQFVITAFNYLKINLIEGKASGFGTDPWWYYIVVMLGVIVPPISIALLASFLLGVIKLKNDLFTWAIVPFVIVHSIIGHKETRFLFPMSYIFIFISIYGLMVYFRKRKITKFYRIIFKVSVGLNTILILLMMFRPANEMVANYQYLNNHIDLGKRTIVIPENEKYLIGGLKSSFYNLDNFHLHRLKSTDQPGDYLRESNIDSCFFVYNKFDFEGDIAGYKIEKVYSVYPEWLKKIEFVDWQSALHTHSLFLITRKKDS